MFKIFLLIIYALPEKRKTGAFNTRLSGVFDRSLGVFSAGKRDREKRRETPVFKAFFCKKNKKGDRFFKSN